MESKLIKVSADELKDNVFKLIGADWMLITAGNVNSYNTMTASWGAMGVLWNKNVCFCFIRPARHTRLFVEKNKSFTLSFFDEKYRNALNLCGTISGRDSDKAKEAGITPVESPSGSVCFSEARLVIECKKIYFQDIDYANFLDESIGANYPKKDYHRMYVGEITGCYVKK
jgi:flavin reductase (DIM6/NTAB) family NADH-FMN oxidoreductase RutF